MTKKYKKPAHFRDALKSRLKQRASQKGMLYNRYRQLVLFERFAARIYEACGDLAILKGGKRTSPKNYTPGHYRGINQTVASKTSSTSACLRRMNISNSHRSAAPPKRHLPPEIRILSPARSRNIHPVGRPGTTICETATTSNGRRSPNSGRWSVNSSLPCSTTPLKRISAGPPTTKRGNSAPKLRFGTLSRRSRPTYRPTHPGPSPNAQPSIPIFSSA